jgi:hypothetical protein
MTDPILSDSTDVVLQTAVTITVELTEAERYAAVFALLREVDSLAESIRAEYDTFTNAPAERWELPACDVADLARSMSRVLPALDALAAMDVAA